MPSLEPLDYALPAASVLVLVCYHLVVPRIARNRDRLASAFACRVRAAWVEKLIKERTEILAVQTLRNLTMASNLMTTTSFIVAAGLLSFAVSAKAPPEVLGQLRLVGTSAEELYIFKIATLMVLFFLNFFNFAMTIRYYNHVVVAINAPAEAFPDNLNHLQATVRRMMVRATQHYTWGMRGYYFAIPLALWFFGPLWMLIGAILLIPVLALHDILPAEK
jgi:uncharacterized membrane protein